jgi:hypothetical protein
VSLTQRPRRHPDAAYQLVDDEALIVLSGRSAVHLVLNETGAIIWDLLDGEHDLDDIARAIVASFDVEESVARRDVEEFLETLAVNGMLATDAGEQGGQE